MSLFLILVGVSVVGVLGVFWLLKNEQKPSLRNLEIPSPTAPQSPSRPAAPSPLAGLLGKFPKLKMGTQSALAPKSIAPEIPLPSATGLPPKAPAQKSVEVSAAEEKRIEKEIELTSQLEEWKAKYERLDNLFKEKSASLEKSEQLLQAELSNRREFNKVKDLLEKELKEVRDKARAGQMELTAAKTEGEGYKTKIAQLEEKVTRLENAVIAKEETIADLTKRLDAAASVVTTSLPPPVAALPPEVQLADVPTTTTPTETPASPEPLAPQPVEEKKEQSTDKPEGASNA